MWKLFLGQGHTHPLRVALKLCLKKQMISKKNNYTHAMSSPEIIAQGEGWNTPYVCQRFRSRGVPERKAKDLLYKVEQHFSLLAAQLGCQAEWSIRFAEVMGDPEDFQFDLDQLREAAISDAAEEHLDSPDLS